MEDKSKNNKGYKPAENKQVKIKFFPNRAAEGVAVDADGCAVVDEQTANYLIGIKYAEMVKE